MDVGNILTLPGPSRTQKKLPRRRRMSEDFVRKTAQGQVCQCSRRELEKKKNSLTQKISRVQERFLHSFLFFPFPLSSFLSQGKKRKKRGCTIFQKGTGRDGVGGSHRLVMVCHRLH